MIERFLLWWFRLRMKKIKYFIKEPILAQRMVWEGLIEDAKWTAWGEVYGYKDFVNIEDYQKKVPLGTYEDVFPYIERMLAGESNVLWPGLVKWFAKSSGTTNARSKFIPVSKECLEGCHIKGGKDMLSIYLSQIKHSNVFKGDVLTITGSLTVLENEKLIQAGDVSAVIAKNLPWWVGRKRVPALHIALMPEWEEKANCIVDEAQKYNVTTISGTPTWTAVLLERILKKHNVKSIHKLWPKFEVFFHGAVAFGPYRPLFAQLIPDGGVRYMEIYNASEGFFAVQDRLSSPGEMILLLDNGVFYEFIPMEVFGTENQFAVTLDKVEKEKVYALVISTNAGLWRYIIGDTIKFTSLAPYRIKITGRTKHFINAFGEELVVENAESAIAKVCEELNTIVKAFTAAPKYMSGGKSGAHEWIIEFEKEPNDKNEFIKKVDEYLRELNSDYDAKRNGDVILKIPDFHFAPKGTFYEWMKIRNKLGGQHKVPPLSNTREFVDGLLGMLGEK